VVYVISPYAEYFHSLRIEVSLWEYEKRCLEATG
jgi:hypothetical protein